GPGALPPVWLRHLRSPRPTPRADPRADARPRPRRSVAGTPRFHPARVALPGGRHDPAYPAGGCGSPGGAAGSRPPAFPDPATGRERLRAHPAPRSRHSGTRRVQRPGRHEKTTPGPSVRGEVGRLCRSLRRPRSQVIDPGGSRPRRHARGGTRTHTPLRATDFEPAAFADFATPRAVLHYDGTPTVIPGPPGAPAAPGEPPRAAAAPAPQPPTPCGGGRNAAPPQAP